MPTRCSIGWKCLGVALLCAAAPAFLSAEVDTREVDYQHDDEALRGYLARDTARDDYRGAVLVVHEWWGLNGYTKQRTRQLAELGYIAFALDMYGQDKVTDDPGQAGQWAGALYQDRSRLRARAQAGLDAFRDAAELGDTPVAAIGYCFGGTTVTELAWSGADLAGVVSFHGNPKPAMEEDTERIEASVLICHGAADGNVPQDELNAYTDSLDEADADWMLIVYAAAKHSFTNPASAARESENIGYNETADRRSWEHMKLFFEEVLDE
ncbi:MAG: dienelactone hydrolase family protein [Phycisphaeraceae bacterium]